MSRPNPRMPTPFVPRRFFLLAQMKRRNSVEKYQPCMALHYIPHLSNSFRSSAEQVILETVSNCKLNCEKMRNNYLISFRALFKM